MLQIGSLGDRLRWSLVLGYLVGVLLELALMELRVKKLDRAEGKTKLDHGPDDLS